MREVATTWSVSYSVGGNGAERTVLVGQDGIARPGDFARVLGISVERSEDEGSVSWRVSALPQEDVAVTGIRATFGGLDIVRADAIFLNGHNSWTDSVERHPLAAMRGLAGVPRTAIDRWVLDNSGDYRFVEQDVRPGHQHGMGYGYLRMRDGVLLVGSLDEDSGLTVVREDARKGTLSLEKEPPAGMLRAGQRQELQSAAVCEGALGDAFRTYVGLMGVTRRPAPALVGYSSWYRHYGDIDAGKLAYDLAATAALYDGRDLGACRAVFQVDDGWCKVGDWLWPDADRFPQGMAGIAAECEGLGLVPGIWLAPFLAERESRIAAEHPSWLLRDGEGELVSAGGNWSGAWALDTRNPEVREHIARFMGMVTHEWGYRLLKLDFLFGACLEPHDGMNRGPLLADALDLLRESVPQGTWFDLCGVPMTSAFGRCEYCRVGCDVGLDWDGPAYMRLLHRERVSTRRSLANTRGRAHLDGVVFRNDPDVFFLRDDVSISGRQRAELLAADATLGGMLLTSDDVGEWTDAQRARWEDALSAFVRRNS